MKIHWKKTLCWLFFILSGLQFESWLKDLRYFMVSLIYSRQET